MDGLPEIPLDPRTRLPLDPVLRAASLHAFRKHMTKAGYAVSPDQVEWMHESGMVATIIALDEHRKKYANVERHGT